MQLLERALEECGDDLDSAIRSLNELRLGSVENLGSAAAAKSGSAQEANVQFQTQGASQIKIIKYYFCLKLRFQFESQTE